MEDAATLAECLARAESEHDIPRVLRAYQQIREPRCKMVQAKARMLRGGMMLHDGPAQQGRDETFKSFRSWQFNEPWVGEHIDELPASVIASNYMAWQNGHDAALYVSLVRHCPFVDFVAHVWQANHMLDPMSSAAPAEAVYDVTNGGNS